MDLDSRPGGDTRPGELAGLFVECGSALCKQKAKALSMELSQGNRKPFALLNGHGHCPLGQWPLGHSTM